jgi:SAM-dependent methyltransferase
MSDMSNTEFELDALMRRIRDDVARRKPAAGRVSAAVAPGPIALPRLPELSGSIALKDRYALAEFLAFHDEDFVYNAYRGILRREPDAGGFAAFLESLREGRMSKVEVLGRMRFSAEGRVAAVEVRGLPLAFALQSAGRVPVLGRMLGIARYLYRLPNIVGNHEQFEATYFQRQLELHRQVNIAEAKIEREIIQVQRSLQDMDGATRANIDSVRAKMATATAATTLERSVEMLHTEVHALGDSMATREDVMRLEVGSRLAAIEHALEFKADSENLTHLTNRIVEQLERRPEKADLEALAGRTAVDLRTMRAALDALASVKADRALIEALTVRIAEFGEVVATVRAVREQEQRLAALIEEAHRRSRASPGAAPEAPAQEDIHLFDDFYAAFENHFRGTTDDIRERVAMYLPMVREARAGTAKAPVLDIGCGRGEWLDLLKENGLAARGVDLNRVTVARCRERGLDIIEGDAIEYLLGLEADSLGAVTAMHVIEHIPFRRLIVLLDEVLRVLRPGGVAIFETPNPENLVVGACSFYNDPTHERPLPPEPTRVVAELRGFVDVSVLRLHPAPESLQLNDGAPAVRELVNRVIYGAQDYALVARKPKR